MESQPHNFDQTEKKLTKYWFKKFLFNLAILALSIIFILVILEIAVRIFTKPVYPILRTDKKVGTIHQKNFSGQIWNEESNTWNYIKTNSLGYIGDEIIEKKSSQTTRIAVLGDSMTEGLQVDYYNNFVSKLNTALNLSSDEEQKQFEILNFGVGGSGTFLQYQTYKHNIIPLNPEAVFVVFGSNDYSDNLNKSSFDLENYAGGKNRRIWLKDFLLRFQLPKFVFVKFQHNLVFLEILNKFGLYELSDNLRDYRHGLDIAESQEYYEYTFSIIRKFKELCQRNNTEFLMIIMPLEKDYQEKDKWQSNNGIVKMVEFLEKEQIKYLNPCQVLFEARKRYSKEECFNFGCRAGHLTKLGHQEFAKILFQYIKDNF
jgi:hypothetical protein